MQDQDKLSKAMGAAFLAHKVSQLEESVNKIHFSRDPRLANLTTRTAGSSTLPKETRVVDASVLIHALPLLKKWIREDTYRFVVPLQVISTLDILKKSPPPLHDLARDATRFLENQFNIARQLGDGSSQVRLRAQKAGEETSWKIMENKFVLIEEELKVEPKPLATPVDGEDGDAEECPEPITAQSVPKLLRSTLQCGHFFLPSPLVVFITPRLSSHSESVGEQDPSHRIDFDSLASGATMSYWAQFFQLPTTAIPEKDVKEAVAWAKSMAEQKRIADTARNGRGRGRGVRGGGRGSGGRGRGEGRGGERGGRGEGGGRGGRGGRGGGAQENEGSLFVP